MRPTRFLWYLCLAALAVPTAPAWSAERPGRKYALLVGVRSYRGDAGLGNLKYTENDVNDLADFLKKKAGFREVVVMTQALGAGKPELLPTADNIQANLAALLEGCKKGDTVIVALSGHGLQTEVEGKPEAFFCPMDAQLERRKNLVALSGISRQLEGCKADLKLLLVDACRNDPFVGKGAEAGKGLVPPVPPKGVAALYSCDKGQRSYESDELRHGIFFHYVLKGLAGAAANRKGEVTLASLEDYLTEEVPARVRREISPRARQIPNRKDDVSGKVVLTAGGARAEPPARAALAVLLFELNREEAGRLGLARAGREQFAFVLPDGGADRMGVRRGDVLLRVNGREVTSRGERARALGVCKLGDPLELEVLRAGQRLKLTGRYETKIDPEEEARQVRQAAEEGDAAAQVALAEMYAGGRGVARDDAEAARWYRKAADRGLAHAQNELGRMYADGRGVIKDDAEAARWFRRAADQGHFWGQYWLGKMCADGRGVIKDDAAAVHWFRRAADQGLADAQTDLGWMYEHGRGVTRDYAEAVRWYRLAADQGFALGENNLGMMYAHGLGVGRDDGQALRWFRKAADQGNAWGQNNLGWMYANGRGVARDDAEAVRWYRKAASQRLALAEHNLGWMCETGRGVARDDAEAVRWYRKAADQGLTDAQNDLGRMYANGRGVARDDAEAVRWYRKAAEQGNAWAQSNLGWMCETGRGVTKDAAEAARWYRKAADQGEPVAQNNLGVLYVDGRGVAKDYAEAVKWYRKAADQGQPDAQSNLGGLYENGWGVAKNLAEARRWYVKAAAQGQGDAKKALERLDGK